MVQCGCGSHVTNVKEKHKMKLKHVQIIMQPMTCFCVLMINQVHKYHKQTKFRFLKSRSVNLNLFDDKVQIINMYFLDKIDLQPQCFHSIKHVRYFCDQTYKHQQLCDLICITFCGNKSCYWHQNVVNIVLCFRDYDN